MNEKYVIDKIKEIEEAGATPKEHTHTVSDISDMPSEFPPESHIHSAGDITSGTLDAARIPALTSDKIPNLDASKITSGVLDVARIPDISGNIVSQLEGQFASKTETDAFDARIAALEAGEFESVTSDNIIGNLNGKLILNKASGTGDTVCGYLNSMPDITTGYIYHAVSTVNSNTLSSVYSADFLSVFNKSDDFEFINPPSLTCTITMRLNDATYGAEQAGVFKVTDTMTGEIVLNTSQKIESSIRSASFNRLPGHEYLIEVSFSPGWAGYYYRVETKTEGTAKLYLTT